MGNTLLKKTDFVRKCQFFQWASGFLITIIRLQHQPANGMFQTQHLLLDLRQNMLQLIIFFKRPVFGSCGLKIEKPLVANFLQGTDHDVKIDDSKQR